VLNRRELSEKLHRRNAAQVAYNNGEIEEEYLKNALDKAMKGVEVEEMGGDYFEPIYSAQGAPQGKVFLSRKPRESGLGTSAITYQAMLAAEKLARDGKIDVNLPSKDLQEIAAFLKENVMDTSISEVGKKGVRSTKNISPNQILYRAAALFGDVERGYDPRHGQPFNNMKGQGITPIDAGHIISHASRPDLSNDPSNIGFQNQYENKGQATAEKLASQSGREATGDEIANMLFKSIINRSVKDVSLPRKGSKAYLELLDSIDSKIMQDSDVKRFAGSPEVQDVLQRVTAERDAQAAGAVVGEKPTVINAGEGSRVYVEATENGDGDKTEKIKAILKNGNGKNGKR
jgi:hypothetical protein